MHKRTGEIYLITVTIVPSIRGSSGYGGQNPEKNKKGIISEI